jgi:pimeloyl-ACP methyl ester carboxylesterase
MAPQSVKAGDLTVSYTQVGSGPPLVLLHGGLATAEMSWSGRYDQLAGHFRILAPDTRGHGLTDNPAGRLGYDQFADDVVAFCNALGIERPLIVGYSDGGQTAIELALRHPGFAQALVMGGTISERTPAYMDGLTGWGFPAPGNVDFDVVERVWGTFFDTIQHAHKGNGEPDYWKKMLVQISTLWLTVPTYSLQQLQSITAPTLIAVGDRDHMAGLDQAQRMYQAIPHCELAVIPNATHGASETDLFWANVLDFLKRHSTT